MTTRASLKLLSALLIGPWLLVVACTGSSDGDDDDEAFVDEAKFRERFPAQLCGQIAQCCHSVDVPIDEPNCLEQAAVLVEDLAGTGVDYDGAAAAACLRGYATPLARCVVPSATDLGPCNTVYTGHVPAGEACQSSAECVDGTFCEADIDGNLVCVGYGLPEPGVEGDACTDSCFGSYGGFESCIVVSADVGQGCYENDGLECAWDTLTCQPSPGVGEPCEYYCAPGAYCDYSTFTCQALIPDGGACAFDEQCERDSCPDGECGEAKIGASLCSGF